MSIEKPSQPMPFFFTLSLLLSPPFLLPSLPLFILFFSCVRYFGKQPKNVPVADVRTEGVCMLFANTPPYGTQCDHHNNQ